MTAFGCSADASAREMRAPRKIKAGAHAMSAAMVRSFQLLVAALREIFDESAYQRFLDRTQRPTSAGAYAVFRQENEQAKLRRPKCC